MSRRTKIGLAAVALALALTATAVAGRTYTPTTMTLTLQAKQVQSSVHFVDNAPAGESAGDTVSFSQILYSGNTRVGFAEVSGTLVDSKHHDADNLVGTLIVKHGTIVLQGTSLGTAVTQRLAIVGGTGKYAGAHGQAVITNGPHLSTLRLTLDRR